MLSESENPMTSLIGLELSGVCFVRDYVQLQFDDRGLTALTLPVVIANGKTYVPGQQGYRDALCERIDHVVKETSFVEKEGISIKFDDGFEISISLREKDYLGPEAVIFHDASNQTWVW